MEKKKDTGDKDIITFDTESELFEEIKTLIAGMDTELPDDSPVLQFKKHFDDAYEFFVKTYKLNQQLLQKTQEQNALIMQSAAKTATILKIVQSDSATIQKYKQEHDEVSTVIKSLHDSENRSRDLLTKLSEVVATLHDQVQRGEAFSYGEEDTIGSITQDVRNLTLERDKAAKEINEATTSIAHHSEQTKNMKESIKKMKEVSVTCEHQIGEFQVRLDALSTEVEQTRKGIGVVRPIVDSNKEKIEKNKEKMRELNGRINEKKGVNYETGKKLLEITTTLKTSKYGISQKTKKLNKTMKQNEVLNEACDKLDADIAYALADLQRTTAQDKDLDEMIKTGSETLDNLNEQCEFLEKEKARGRMDTRERREQTMKLKGMEVVQGNERNRIVRNIHATTRDQEVVKGRLRQEKKTTDNIKGLGVDLVHETRAQKRIMQNDKIKLRHMEREIETKQMEVNNVNAQKLLVSDERMNNEQKLLEDTLILEDMNNKNIQQSTLAEALRNERNALKKHYEACKKEETILRNGIADAQLAKEELEKKLRETEIDIAEKHFRCRDIQQSNVLMEENVKELKKLVVDANHSISALLAEEQLLKHVLEEAASDKNLQAKEYASAEGAKKAICGVLVERRATVDELKSQIVTLNMHIRKGFNQYREKCDEIKKLNEEAAAAVDKNIELEKIMEKRMYTQAESRRLFNLFSQETQKNAALISEINLPRNVHRWMMYGATDETYARNIQYLSKIYARLDEAHREQIELNKIRDDLKAKLEQKMKGVMENGEKEKSSFNSYVDKYKTDLASKTESINSLKEQVEDHRSQIAKLQSDMDKLRGRVNDRRSTRSQLRCRNLASRNEKRQTLLFLTEPPTPKPFGGGFVQKFTAESTQTMSEGSECLIAQSAPKSNRRMTRVNTPAQKPPGKIMRPQTTLGNKRRPNAGLAQTMM